VTDVRTGSLWRDRVFRTLWLGQATSEIGGAVTALVLPLFAIGALGAGPGELGLLQACAAISFLVASIPGGVLVDRSRKRLVMLVCDTGRGLVLATVPALAAFHRASMAQLYAVAFVTGVLGVVFGLAYHAYYPVVVRRERLAEANTKIGSTEAAARVIGPSLAAALVGAIGASLAIVVDVGTYVVSTVSLAVLRTDADVARPAATGRRLRLRAETAAGFRLVRTDPVLFRTALCTLASMFCLSMTSVVFIYFLVHDLRVAPGYVGVAFAIGEGGGLLAAVLSGRLMRRVGTARLIWLVTLLSPAGFLATVATHGSAVVLASAFMVLSSARFVLFDIGQYLYRQTACPVDKLGRVNATIRLGVGTSAALGALAGGTLGGLIGARATIAAATALLCLASLPVLFSPLRGVRDLDTLMPAPPEPAEVG
jgi:MFS family permease